MSPEPLPPLPLSVLRTPLEPLRLRASLIAHSVCGVCGVRRVLRTHGVAWRVLRARGVAWRVLRARDVAWRVLRTHGVACRVLRTHGVACAACAWRGVRYARELWRACAARASCLRGVL